MLAASVMLAACSSDDEPVVPKPIDKDFQGIVLNIANPRAKATRGDNELINIEGDEGKISNLAIVAYPESGDPVVKVVTELNNTILPTEKYVQVPVKMDAGKYDIFVIANVDKENLYKDNGNTSFQSAASLEAALSTLKTPADLEALSLAVAPTHSASAIPMSCHASAITWKYNGEEKTGKVEIKAAQSTQVYATLIFAMAKVNYTVWNGKASFLRMADANRVVFTHTANRVGLVEHLHGDDNITAAALNVGDGGKFYPCSDTDYDDTDGPDDYSCDPDEAKDALSDTDKQWAFHGTAYVPERLFVDTHANPTKIKFNFKASDGTTDVSNYSDNTHLEFGGKEIIDDPLNPGSAGGAAEHYGVVRGVIYDVLVFTTKKEITLKVRVRPWDYKKFTWDL